MRQKVVSREYKAMLKRERFFGSRDGLIERAGDFWEFFKESIQGVAFDTDGSLHELEKQKTIRFYDTSGRHLQKNDYVFRERIESGTGKREVTLKFRHADRYISQDRDMTAAAAKKSKTKFEEDIKLPFKEFYAFSAQQMIPSGKSLTTLDDLAKLYPGLKKRLQPFQKDEAIEVVGDFVAQEIVVTGADFQIGKNPKVEAECALIVWYDKAGKQDQPVVVEFSFRYGNEREEYARAVAQKAYDVFGTLRVSFTDWIDFEGPTKTAYVYSRP